MKIELSYPTLQMYLSSKTQSLLNKKLKQLNALRPIFPSALAKIREQFQLEMTYNSNAIEGNSLTLKETFWVIQEGLTIKGKPLKDHLEAKNHQEALEFLYELVDHESKNTLSEHQIRQLHHLVVKESQSDVAGKYRDGQVMITGTDHIPPPAYEISPMMNDLVNWYRKNRGKYHVVELAAILHHKLAYIHPFWDGNGRTARLVMNVLILEAGYPLAIVLKNDRKRYYRVLGLADKGKYGPLCEFIAQAVLRSLTIYLQALTPMQKKQERFLPLKELEKGSPYSANYLRKLATQGKLEALKKGRNWVTTKEAIERYRKGNI